MRDPLGLLPAAPGLRRNARLFALLVLVNAFVGAMVGMERTLVPLLGEREFGVASRAALLSFIATFGLVKAFANLAAGAWSETLGRRRLLVAGWLVGLPVPVVLMLAPAPQWGLVVGANVLLGVNQGLCWSMAVVMKVDIAGEARRGLALGLNEFAGYVAVAAAAFLTGLLAAEHGLRPVPFLVGLGAALAGLALSAFLVPETVHLARPSGTPARRGTRAQLKALKHYSWGHRAMVPINQAGLVNNLNDGVAWGLFPLVFAAALPDTAQVGSLVALYPLSWGALQLATGPLSDAVGRKGLIVAGMGVQALAIAAIVALPSPPAWVAAMLLLGVGTAMVYPSLLSAVGDVVPPAERATALGVYRFWRDLGFAVGALGAGALADAAGLDASILATALLTLLSGLHVAAAMREPHRVPAGAARAGRPD